MSKTLLVIGASSEIGCSLLRRQAHSYDKIVAHYCSSYEALEQVKREIGFGDETQFVPIQADLTEEGSVDRMLSFMEQQGLYPDHIVHLAANKLSALHFVTCPKERYEEDFRCSVSAFVEIARRMLPSMTKKKNGRIVIMLTACTHNVPPKFFAPYVTAKYALLGLMKALAVEFASKGISVNAVSPEMTDTRFLADLPELAIELNREQSVMGRNLHVDEVVPTIEFLLSEEAGCITGQNILISGVKRGSIF